MEPTKKSKKIEELLTEINPRKVNREETIRRGVCTWCGDHVGEFRDELSIKEYTISGFCQKCQDDTFGK